MSNDETQEVSYTDNQVALTTAEEIEILRLENEQLRLKTRHMIWQEFWDQAIMFGIFAIIVIGIIAATISEMVG